MTIRTRIRSSAQAAGKSALTAPTRGGRPSHGGGGLPSTAGDNFEWDMRRNDGPTDRALYDCGCGYKFTARVATTVSCPHCGAGQAW